MMETDLEHSSVNQGEQVQISLGVLMGNQVQSCTYVAIY